MLICDICGAETTAREATDLHDEYRFADVKEICRPCCVKLNSASSDALKVNSAYRVACVAVAIANLVARGKR